ncbi:hypothetical protein C0J29_21400 [Mycobacterium paragordonae]|nr:hypothetical protein C0J29_21400 [Mycobacterium paragordonae]
MKLDAELAASVHEEFWKALRSGLSPTAAATVAGVSGGRAASGPRLATGEARIWAKSDDGMMRARVTILIPEASEFD